jgi:hypothetical protein
VRGELTASGLERAIEDVAIFAGIDRQEYIEGLHVNPTALSARLKEHQKEITT